MGFAEFPGNLPVFERTHYEVHDICIYMDRKLRRNFINGLNPRTETPQKLCKWCHVWTETLQKLYRILNINEKTHCRKSPKVFHSSTGTLQNPYVDRNSAETQQQDSIPGQILRRNSASGFQRTGTPRKLCKGVEFWIEIPQKLCKRAPLPDRNPAETPQNCAVYGQKFRRNSAKGSHIYGQQRRRKSAKGIHSWTGIQHKLSKRAPRMDRNSAERFPLRG